MESNRYAEEEYRMISEIQHFAFCRRQWALIHLEQQWSDNYLTTAGNIIHERVHAQNLSDVRNGIITIRGMRVKSSVFGLSGECDAVELVPSDDGIALNGKSGLWQPYPVEYKHGKQKVGDCDRLQVAAQAMCLEEMFSHPIPQGYLFYYESRRREIVPITDEIRSNLEMMVHEMHEYANAGHTPHVRITSRCESCSLNDVCMPSLMSKRESPTSYIKRHLEEQ